MRQIIQKRAAEQLMRLIILMKRFPVSSLVIGLFLLILAFTIYGVSRPVSHNRDFVEHLSRLPHVEFSDDSFSVSPIRNWSYEIDGPLEKTWIETPTEFQFEDLEKIWFVVEPHPGMEAMAHTLLLFEFSDDRLLGLTIEARRETGEGYSAFWGNWGKFELLYVWANARDLVQRRAIHLQKQVEIYPIALEHSKLATFFKRMLRGTRRIEKNLDFTTRCFPIVQMSLVKMRVLGGIIRLLQLALQRAICIIKV